MSFFRKYCIFPDGPGCIACPSYEKCQMPRDFECTCEKGKEEKPDCEFHTKIEIIIIIKAIINRGFSFYDEYYNKLDSVEKIVDLKRAGRKIKFGKGVDEKKWNIGYA